MNATTNLTISSLNVRAPNVSWANCSDDESSKLQAAYESRLETALSDAYPDAEVDVSVDRRMCQAPIHTVVVFAEDENEDGDDFKREQARREVTENVSELSNRVWMETCEAASEIFAA